MGGIQLKQFTEYTNIYWYNTPKHDFLLLFKFSSVFSNLQSSPSWCAEVIEPLGLFCIGHLIFLSFPRLWLLFHSHEIRVHTLEALLNKLASKFHRALSTI